MSYSTELGQHGFDRIAADTKIHHADNENARNGSPGTNDSGNQYYPEVSKWVAILIVDGATAFDAGTEVVKGSIPNASDAFSAGTVIQGPFRKIELSAGVVYAYRAS